CQLALHGLQLKIKRELHSPCLELSATCSQERPLRLQYGDKCPYVSAYEQKQPAGMKPSSPVTPPCSSPVSPLHHGSPNPERSYSHAPASQPLPDSAYAIDHRFRRQLSEPCHSFPSPPALSRDTRPMYQRQMSEPNIPFPPQGFKQEYPDPLFEHPAMMGAPLPHAYPPSMMIKQEPRDFTYDSGELKHHSASSVCPFQRPPSLFTQFDRILLPFSFHFVVIVAHLHLNFTHKKITLYRYGGSKGVGTTGIGQKKAGSKYTQNSFFRSKFCCFESIYHLFMITILKYLLSRTGKQNNNVNLFHKSLFLLNVYHLFEQKQPSHFLQCCPWTNSIKTWI
uniref:ETS variant transcription factor 1 n=1 Tax=Neogobius melanostomus TaxID=47308 RepID=A0A8C6U285_9GOBI